METRTKYESVIKGNSYEEVINREKIKKETLKSKLENLAWGAFITASTIGGGAGTIALDIYLKSHNHEPIFGFSGILAGFGVSAIIYGLATSSKRDYIGD